MTFDPYNFATALTHPYTGGLNRPPVPASDLQTFTVEGTSYSCGGIGPFGSEIVCQSAAPTPDLTMDLHVPDMDWTAIDADGPPDFVTIYVELAYTSSFTIGAHNGCVPDDTLGAATSFGQCGDDARGWVEPYVRVASRSVATPVGDGYELHDTGESLAGWVVNPDSGDIDVPPGSEWNDAGIILWPYGNLPPIVGLFLGGVGGGGEFQGISGAMLARLDAWWRFPDGPPPDPPSITLGNVARGVHRHVPAVGRTVVP